MRLTYRNTHCPCHVACTFHVHLPLSSLSSASWIVFFDSSRHTCQSGDPLSILFFSYLGSRPHNVGLRDHETLSCLHLYRVSRPVGMQIAEHMTFDPVAMEYYPTIFFNDFWLLKDYLIPMNETVTEVPLSFTLSTMTLWKFTLFSQMDQAFGKQVCSLDSSHSYCSPC